MERAPAWAEKFFNLQQVSEKHLEELELSLKTANQTPMVEDPQASYTFTKKLYQEQFSFNQSIAQKLAEACDLLDDSNVSVQELLHEGMDMIKSRNKLLVINDRCVYETRQAYAKDPLAEDSDDARNIKKARKEALHVEDEKKRQQKRTKSSSSGSIRKPFLRHGQFCQPSGGSASRLPTCFRCNRVGHIARSCRAGVLPVNRPNFGPVPQPGPVLQ